MIIDSHCHLDYPPLNADLDKVLARAEKSGVKYFLTICTEDKSFEKILNILKNIKTFLEPTESILTKQKTMLI